MKAMVLAAGLGLRLRPLTLQRAKPALRLVDGPVLGQVLAWLAGYGVRDVVVNLHHLPDTVRPAVAGGLPSGMTVHFSLEPEILGTGGGLAAAAEHFRGEDEVLLVNGDCLYDFDLGPVLDRHREARPLATLALLEMPAGESYGAVEIDLEGRVRRIAGHPEEDARPGDLQSMHYPGAQVLSREALDALPAEGPSDIFRDTLTPRIGRGGRVLGVTCPGRWHDVGTPRRLLSACTDELEARCAGAWIAPTARVHAAARVDGRSVIGEGAVLEAGARVEGSLVLDGASVGRGCRVRDSILGYDTALAEGENLEEAVLVEIDSIRHRRSLEGAGS